MNRKLTKYPKLRSIVVDNVLSNANTFDLRQLNRKKTKEYEQNKINEYEA